MGKEQVDVIRHGSRLKQISAEIPDDTSDIVVQFRSDRIVQKGFAVLRRENHVDENLGKGLRHEVEITPLQGLVF